MILSIKNILLQAKEEVKNSQSIDELYSIKIKFLGKKGLINQQFNILKTINFKDKPSIGNLINNTKKNIKKIITEKEYYIKNNLIKKKIFSEEIDISLPGKKRKSGSLHPISNVINYIKNFFERLGFCVIYGPEIENKKYNFDYLNIPLYHPSRMNKDTFWLNDNYLLRTQTSNVQIRIMKKQKPPIRAISYGKVFRHDNDHHHTPMFHQLEGLVVDFDISFANLKSILYAFLHYFFSNNINIRFRSSYFPFTEPSAEIDIMDKDGKWIEILGCGMIHPKILSNCHIDFNKYSGFAFGVGIERLIMLKYGIKNVKILFKNDVRFLEQFIYCRTNA